MTRDRATDQIETASAGAAAGNGTLIESCVPAPARDWMSSVPATDSSRSLMLMRPRSPSPRVVDVEAHAIVDDRHDQRARLANQAHHDAAGRAVRERIVQRLLRDAEQAERDVMRQGFRDVVGRKIDDAVGSGQLALEAAQRGNQTQHPQARRVQLVRQIVQALGDAVRSLTRLLDKGHRVRALTPFSKQFQIDRQQRHLLVDVVVQFARDPCALGFLGQQ